MKNFLHNPEKLIEYLASAVFMVSSNVFVRLLRRTKLYFIVVINMHGKKLSTQKITTFLNQNIDMKKGNRSETLYHILNKSICKDQHF